MDLKEHKDIQQVNQYTDTITNSYNEAKNKLVFYNFFEKPTNKFHYSELSKKIKPEYILDLACGNGKYARILKTYFPSAKIIGVDLSDTMIFEANEIKSKNKEEDLFFLQGDCVNNLKEIYQRIKKIFNKEVKFELINSIYLVDYAINSTELKTHFSDVDDIIEKNGYYYVQTINPFSSVSCLKYFRDSKVDFSHISIVRDIKSDDELLDTEPLD